MIDLECAPSSKTLDPPLVPTPKQSKDQCMIKSWLAQKIHQQK